MADLPAGAARPEAWEVEYGFRYTGGWNSAPWTGQVDQSIPRGKGRGEVWICTIAGLEPDSSYVFRIRARAEGWEARGLGWGDWSERSSVIATLDEQSDEQATKPSGFFSTAGTYLKEGIEGIRREIVSGDMEPPELNEWAAPVQAEAPPVVLTDHNAFEFQPSEGYMQVEDESVCEPSDGRFELGLEIRLYKSKPRQSRTGGKPPNAPPVLCIARIARESVAARKPGLQPGLELISVMDRPAATLLRAGQAQEEIAGSLASIWRTCLELNQPLRMNFSKRVSSQWAPERKPSALQNQERSIPSRTGATQAGSDNDDDSAVKIQHDALQISREDSDLETLNSDDDHDVELDLTTSVALREVERLEAKLAATDALLHGIDDPPDSRAGPQSVAPVRQRGTDDDDSVAPMHENAAVPVSLPDLSIGGASNSGTGALLDELEVLAGRIAPDQFI